LYSWRDKYLQAGSSQAGSSLADSTLKVSKNLY